MTCTFPNLSILISTRWINQDLSWWEQVEWFQLTEGEPMPPVRTKKFSPEIDAQLYDEFVALAEKNGQTKRHVLEQALRFYLDNVVPSQHLVRSEVMDAFEQSVGRNRDLLQRLAK
jgi:hypothetical protein